MAEPTHFFAVAPSLMTQFTQQGDMNQENRVIAYYRVSTQRQGISGLGLDAQRTAVGLYVSVPGLSLVAEFTEIESGRNAERPELTRALIECRSIGAVLVIAKLDRLARNVAFLSALMDGDVEFRALDLPGASRLVLHFMAAIAEHEATAISERTKAALQAAKARGQVLGSPQNLTALSRSASAASRRATAQARQRQIAPVVRAWRNARWSLETIADALTERKILTPRGGTEWNCDQVRYVLRVAKNGRT